MKGAASTAPRYAIPNYFTNPVIRPYLANVRNWQCYIRFLGLPDRRDNPDILIDRLFVTPLLARRYVSPDENPKSWADEAETLLNALAEHSPLVILGDPGIGKSTFLNYVAWLLSRPADNALIDRMGWRLPLPMVMRELPVRGVTDFDGLLEAFLSREMSAPLREDGGRYLRQALAEGQAFLLLDGIDELGDRTKVSDLCPLVNLSALEVLYFGGTQVSDLEPLADLVTLEQLSLWYTEVSDLGPLVNLAALKALDIAGTQVPDLGPLADLTSLRELDLEDTQVSDLGPLAGLVALRELKLGGIQISDIGPLENLTTLEQLSLESTQVSDIRPLASLNALKWLDLRQTRISVAAIEDLRTLRPELNIVYQD